MDFDFCSEINDNNIDIFRNVLLKCCNIKEFDLRRVKVNGNTLMTIVKFCSKLERFHLNLSKVDVNEHEMTKFAKIIGLQYVKFRIYFGFNNNTYNNLMMKSFQTSEKN